MKKRKRKLYKEVLWAVVKDVKGWLPEMFIGKAYAKNRRCYLEARGHKGFRICKVEVQEIKGGK